jgi:hypothetical protein
MAGLTDSDKIDIVPGAFALDDETAARWSHAEPTDPEEREYQRQLRQKTARRRIQEEEATASFKPFAFHQNLLQQINQGIPEPEWLIDKLVERHANVIVQGSAKSGKSTITMEVIRCLAEQYPLFGEYHTHFATGRIGYVDLEMGERKTLQRLTKVTLTNRAAERIMPLSLVGLGFDIMSNKSYDQLATECKNTDIKILVLDPLVHITSLESENDNAEVSRVIRRLNEFKEDSGVESFIIPAHTPDSTTTTLGGPLKIRGATAWMGWAGHFLNCYFQDSDGTHHFKLGRSREMPDEGDALLKTRRVRIEPQGHLTLSSELTVPAVVLTVNEQKLRDFITKKGAANGAEARKEFSWNSVTYGRAVDGLKDKGLIFDLNQGAPGTIQTWCLV